MNIGQETQKNTLSQDLTVVLIRGNGSPRSFRLRVPALQRAFFALSFLLTFCLIAAAGFAVLYLLKGRSLETPVQVAAPVADTGANSAADPAAVSSQDKPGIWQSVSGMLERNGATPQANDEAQKEIAGLREENAKLNARVESRKALESGASGLIQFFGPASTLMPADQVFVQIKNAKLGRDEQKQITLDFELHNTDAGQKQVRGYILVLAKNADSLSVYPANAFSPNENIVVNFTKGETFAVSRFRAGHATFAPGPLEGKKTSFQIFLFATDGKIMATQHVETKP